MSDPDPRLFVTRQISGALPAAADRSCLRCKSTIVPKRRRAYARTTYR